MGKSTIMCRVNKLVTYSKYLFEFLRYGDIESIFDSFRYILLKRGSLRNRTIRCRLGLIFNRKGTNDFQYANFNYEWNVKSFILNNYKNYKTFFDIGSNIGIYSLWMAKKGLHVFAFEPVTSTFNILCTNIKRNKLEEHIKPFCIGLGSMNYETTFELDSVNTGASHKIDPNFHSNKKNGIFEKIKISKLDDLVQILNFDYDLPVMVKIDVEGMEPEVIAGAEQFIKRCKKLTLIIEDKHSRNNEISDILLKINPFKIGRIDNYNIFASKI